jgi:hypothetical protein
LKKLKLVVILSLISYIFIGFHPLQHITGSNILVNQSNLRNFSNNIGFNKFAQNSTSIEIIDINSASHDMETGIILFLLVFIPWVLFRKYKKNKKQK